MSVIEVKNLSKSFGTLEVLKDVSINIEEGERIVIIGGSGCGKSVFLRSLDLLETPDTGSITIDGDCITEKKADVNKIRQKMGMVYQGFHLFSHMTVLENIILAPVKIKKMSREDATQKAIELLKMVGLESKKDAMPENLSGGQKQRIAIARCLAMEPKIMLFDEPTSALDPTMVGEVLATMRTLAKQNLTMIIVTHEMSFAREVGTRILYFNEKGIYEEGTPEEIFDHPKKEKTKAFIHKMKYFNFQIEERGFDLMKLHGGIQTFGEKYGVSQKYINRLQLCTEELIYEMLSGADDNKISVTVNISYSEMDKSIILELLAKGMEYNPFHLPEDDEAHLGITILNNMAKKINVFYENETNIIRITL